MNVTETSVGSSMRRVVKHTAQRLGRQVPAALYINHPLRRWPRALGMIHEIAVPSGVKPLQQLGSGVANINIILELMDRTALVAGDVAECGVFRGATLLPMAVYVHQRGLGKQIVGFDSFAGFSEAIKIDINLGGADTDACRKVGGFSDTAAEVVLSKVRRLNLPNVELAPGFFDETLPRYDRREFCFVHLDCDMYTSYKECLEFFYPRVPSGGIILFDEYNDPPWPGCNKAVDEFLIGKPEKPVRITSDNYEKYYITKH
jgi:O-methyltransferase